MKLTNEEKKLKLKDWRAIKVRVELAILRWNEKTPLQDGASEDALSHTIMEIFVSELKRFGVKYVK